MKQDFYYIVVDAADCDGGVQLARVYNDETEDDAARRYGGTVVWQPTTPDEYNKEAAIQAADEYEASLG